MRKGFVPGEVVLTLVLLVGLFAVGFLFIKGSQLKEQEIERHKYEQNFNISETLVLRTVKHDEHYWIVPRSGDIYSIIHHPDCPECTKILEKE